jgi:hypothetical protein
MARLPLTFVGLSVAAALAFAGAPFAAAQSADSSVVKTIANPNAPVLITQSVDGSNYGSGLTKSGQPAPAQKYLASPAREGATDLGRMSGGAAMGLQVALRRPDVERDALKLLSEKAQDVHDPMFGKTITPREAAENFGLNGSDLAALTQWLTEKGFAVVSVDNGRPAISFKGTVAQVESAFDTEIHEYRGADGQQHYANVSQWQVPLALVPAVESIQGLQNFTVFEPKSYDGPVTDFVGGPSPHPIAANGGPAPTSLRLDGEMLHDFSFTPSVYATGKDGAYQLNVRMGGDTHAATGNLAITADGAVIASVPDITACPAYGNGMGRSCTIGYSVNKIGSTRLEAVYSGSDFTKAVRSSFVISNVGANPTSLAITPAVVDYTATAASDTLTVVISWTAATSQPTGNITVLDITTGNSLGAITLPAVGSTTSMGASATAPHSGSATYSCTETAADLLFLCTLANPSMTSNFVVSTAGTGNNTLTASYAGDTYFSAAPNGQTYVYYNSASTMGTLTKFTATPAAATAATYGETQAENVTIAIQGSSLAQIFGQYGEFIEGASTLQLGTLYYSTGSTCGTTTSCSIAASYTVPAVVTPSTTAYTITYTYTGDYAFLNGYDKEGTVTQTLLVNQQAPAFGTVTYSPASPVEYGAGVTASVNLNWLGVGEAPQGAVAFAVVNGTAIAGSPFNATCGVVTSSGSGNAMASQSTCAATIPVASLAVGSTYTVTPGSIADVNYSALTGAASSFTVASQTPTLAVTSVSPSSEAYGNAAAVTITAKLTYTGGGAAPTGSPTFSSTAAGPFGTPSCGPPVGDLITCTVTFTPTATDSVRTYTIFATYSGDTNYGPVTSAQTSNFTIAMQAPMLAVTSVSPASEAYGAASAATVTATLTYTGSGTAPTGVPSFSSTAAGAFSGASCGAPSGDVITCTVNFTPTATDAVGTYSVSASHAADANYGAASSTQANNFSITSASTTLALTGATNGATSAGVTSDVLTATTNIHAANVPVVFTDATTGTVLGTVNTNSAGVATATGTTATAGVSAGENNITASIASTPNYSAATSSPLTVYLQGILFSSFNTHNFSGLTTDGAMQVEGTVDGATGAAYGVSVYNFTGSPQGLPVTLTNDATADFTLANSCGATLSAGEACSLAFNYAPVYPAGCNPNIPPASGGCTLDASGYPQGTFESATWSYTLPDGVIAGLGNLGFTTSGKAASGALIEGKAILAAGTITVSPATAAFGKVVQGSTSSTMTVTVTNSNTGSSAFTYAGPATPHFTANNTCSSPLAANTSCSIYVTAVTGTIGTFNDTIVITPTGGSASTVALSSTVSATSGSLTISSIMHNFGNVTESSTASFSATLTNNTGAAATLGFSNMAGTGFTTGTNCGASIAAGASCQYGFTFAPRSTGASADTVTVTSSVPILPGGSGSGPYTDTITVTGTGVSGGNLTITSAGHNFGTLAAGTSGGNYGTEITNSTVSTVTLRFSGLTNTADGFTLVGSNCGASLAANASCEVVFSFKPSQSGLGTVQAIYPITSSAPLYNGGVQVSPEQITLTGTGQ